MNVVKLGRDCVLPLDGVERVTFVRSLRRSADSYGLVVDGERNAPGLAIHLFDDSADAAALPVKQFLLVLLRDVLLLHHHHGCGIDGNAITGELAAHQDTVSGLEIAELDWRCALQIGLPRSQAQNARAGLQITTASSAP